MIESMETMTGDELFQRRVQSLIEITDKQYSLPPGTNFRIEGKHQGLTLMSEPCRCCGVQILLKKVPFNAVKFIPNKM